MNKICVLGANFSTNNMGVGALTMGSLQCLNYAYPKAHLFIMDYSKEPVSYCCELNDKIVPVKLVNIRFTKKVYLSNCIAYLLCLALFAKLLPGKRIQKAIFNRNTCLRELHEADMVASVAGGDSFSDIYGLGRFLYVSLPQLLAVIMNKNLVLMPQTLGPFDGFVTKLVARYIMNRAHNIFSRERNGVDEMRFFLGKGRAPQRVRFSYDMGFILQPVMPVSESGFNLGELKRNHLQAFGVNVSGLLLAGSRRKPDMFGLRTDYRKVIHATLDLLLSRPGVVVLLVPHVLGDSAESDLHACKTIYNEIGLKYHGRLFAVSGAYDQNQIKYIIGQCTFFVGSRMHACIAALSQGIPAVGIAYSKKFLGVMQSVGMESLVADMRALEIDEVMGCIERALANQIEIRQALAQKMPEVKRAVLELFVENVTTQVPVRRFPP